MNYSTLETWELLAEKSHMEQLGFNGEVQLLDIEEELAKRSQKPQEATQETKAPNQMEVLVYDKKRGKYNYTAFNTREVERIKIGHWIIIESYMKGSAYVRLAEQVESIRETKHFYIINGRKMKKNTFRIVLQ